MLGMVGQVGCGLESFDNTQQDQLSIEQCKLDTYKVFTIEANSSTSG